MFEVFKRVKHKKRGSLSLSINAIVILVLAIAMLGLGLAFTKTMFKKFQSKLVVPPPDIPASAEEPIVLPSNELIIKHGDSVTFSVNFYNDYGAGKVEPAIECTESLHPTFGDLSGSTKPGLGITTGNIDGEWCTYTVRGADAKCNVLAASQYVDSGEYKTFQFIVPSEATSTVNTGRDVCEISFCAPGSDGSGGEFDDTQGTSFGDCISGHLVTKQITIRVT